jgi:endonuclease YncB( thermonuclease family)
MLLCLVVGITDGDTIKVRCGEEPQAVVRLAEIDAAEKEQAWASAAGSIRPSCATRSRPSCGRRPATATAAPRRA